ncbi:Putative ATP-dependent RNA helicase DHX30 [Papilio machaon]|uniref:Putative ATP-dependent RNA helicase DHX30 n=1 Tax=Papilio machaon TaxID=76193 RepID=A0A0N0PES5_PAPMA|nr:Putative ATP-dependent RNA helicase DHX30 [Papilio machaon]
MRLPFIIFTLISTCYCKIEFSERARNFSIELLYYTAEETQWHTVISPFGVWTLLTAVSIGATDSSRKQMLKTLILPKKQQTLIDGYKNLTNSVLKTGTPEVELKSRNFLFSDTNFLMKNDFTKSMQRNFGAIVNRIDFKSDMATSIANNIIKNSGLRVTNVLKPSDFEDAKMILTNVISFKAYWKTPFNVSDTKVSPFYDENGKEIGKVNMMYLEDTPPYSSFDEIGASILELAYGDEEDSKYSFLVILPDAGVTVANVYSRLTDISLEDIFDKLQSDLEFYGMTSVVVNVPRFKISTNLVLNSPLLKMGIEDIFDPGAANFKGITESNNVFVSALVHNAVIEVTETGTVASAATYAYFADRARPKRLLQFDCCSQICKNHVALAKSYHSIKTSENPTYVEKKLLSYSYLSNLNNAYKRYYSNSLIDGDVTKLKDTQHEKELKRISQLFPQPRVTLNELNSKTPEKVFDIHYRQNVVAPKGVRKKMGLSNNDWTCTYTFVWPEKIKFESVAISKRQAAEKSATQALHWLYINKQIDNKGNPIYDKKVIEDIKCNLNEPLHVEISDNSLLRIDRIWNDYENEIKHIYEKTFEEANHRLFFTPSMLTKDSTIDIEDNLAEESQDTEIDEELNNFTVSILSKKMKGKGNNTIYRKEITSTLETSRVLVIVGAAGCGKSTRAPAAVLKALGCNTTAIVSEPRRVAAIGLAQRVADEMGEEVGDSIGYQVRLHSKVPRPSSGIVLYCTSGVLLRRLQLNPGLEGCSHVFIDEAHERDVNTDVTLLLLKRALDINPNLKVVIMSATLDTEVFTKYFDPCPIVEVPGRTFPVQVTYLNDIEEKYRIKLPMTLENCCKEDGKPQVYWQEVVEVIKSVDKSESEGAILVFLPGWAEIKQVKKILDEIYAGSTTHMVLPVHSRLSTTEQTRMFEKPAPGIRKIVLATNIAETSITIPDVVYVIDTGAHKENRIKEGTGTASLETVWVSKAGAKQRTGRAGRVQPGALSQSEKLTRLGILLSNMTLHPRLGCSLLHSVILGNTVATANIVSHCSDNIELFSNAPDRREEIREFKRKYNEHSDHSALHWIQDEYERILQEKGWSGVNEWCERYGLRKDRLNYVKSISNLHLQQLLQSSIIEAQPDVTELTRFSDIEELSAGALLSGVNTLLVTRKHVRTKGKLMTIVELFTSSGDRAHIGSESVNYGIKKRKPTTQLLAYFGGHHSTERRALVVYKTTVVSPQAVLLFCKGDIEIMKSEENEDINVLSLPRHRLRIHVPAK